MAKKTHREADETPQEEGRSHTPAFLEKATRIAKKNRGTVKRKSTRKTGRKHMKRAGTVRRGRR